MKRNVVIRRGRNFYAVGWGRRGPYVTYSRLIRRHWYGKASYGTMGPRAGIKYSGKRMSAQGMLNLSTGKPSGSVEWKHRSRGRVTQRESRAFYYTKQTSSGFEEAGFHCRSERSYSSRAAKRKAFLTAR